MIGHVYEKHGSECENPHCNICEGGLKVCTVCGGAEGSLPTECPRRKMTTTDKKLVYEKILDYKNGKWHFPDRRKG